MEVQIFKYHEQIIINNNIINMYYYYVSINDKHMIFKSFYYYNMQLIFVCETW